MKLSSIRRPTGDYLLLNLSEIAVLADVLGLSWGSPEKNQRIETAIQLTAKHLAPLVSGVVLGPELGFSAVNMLPEPSGLLLTLTKQTALTKPEDLPIFEPNWGVTHVRNNYAVLYSKVLYHPHDVSATEKLQLFAELNDACAYEGIQSVLELVLYQTKGEEPGVEKFQEKQLSSVREFQQLANLLVLEYPQTALAAATLTASLDSPWLVRITEKDHAQTKTVLRTALESGSSGIVLRYENLFSGLQLDNHPKPDKTDEFFEWFEHLITTEVRDRVLEISRILSEVRTKSEITHN